MRRHLSSPLEKNDEAREQYHGVPAVGMAAEGFVADGLLRQPLAEPTRP